MRNYLGEIIASARDRSNQTQDEYGSKYGVSGPAIFKFEKGYVRPSLQLWLQMAGDANVSEKRAVLLWIKSKLPEKFQEYVELQSAAGTDPERTAKSKKKAPIDYSKLKTREDILAQIQEDPQMPSGLLGLIQDDELWALYKPTGREINDLRNIFGPLGQGVVSQYREALCVLRSFKGSE